MVARKDAEILMGYVESSNHWLMEHISILHRCGDCLQESVGDVSALPTCYAYPTLTNSVSDFLGQMEGLRSSLVTQLDERSEDVEAVDLDLKRYLPNLRQGVEALVSQVCNVEHTNPSTLPSGVLTSSSIIIDDSTGLPLLSLGELISKVVSVG